MNVLGVGPMELIVILVVALVFVGPERLPKLAADIARTIREIRKYTGSLAAEFNEVIQDFEKDTAGEKSAWKEIQTGITGATQSVTEAVRDIRAEVQGTPATATALPAAPSVPEVDIEAAPEPVRWAEIPSNPPEAQPGVTAPATNGAQATNGNGAHPAAPAATDELR